MPPFQTFRICTGCGKRKRRASFIGSKSRQPCKSCDRKAKRKVTAEGGRPKQAHHLRKYGLTREDYAEMLAAQDGVCALCDNPETMTREGAVRLLAVDHDHETGAVRALLCARCNAGLGNFDDDPVALRAAALYLEEHKER